jgi:hypothetical protein
VKGMTVVGAVAAAVFASRRGCWIRSQSVGRTGIVAAVVAVAVANIAAVASIPPVDAAALAFAFVVACTPPAAFAVAAEPSFAHGKAVVSEIWRIAYIVGCVLRLQLLRLPIANIH